MAALFDVNIVLPDRTAYDKEASSLVVPAEFGYLGILAHHAPIIAKLKPGKITLRDSLGKLVVFTLDSNGFLEFSDNKATLLVDSLELPS
ncbi:MAG: F0F1 ATP synthase subunit epsilon [Candidatus Omnitrophica bacterium]|nr:F0F1 ATP synthase subunit epsilon [Candidatus Omnitrophota bacterium]